jgi:hypothetical protein
MTRTKTRRLERVDLKLPAALLRRLDRAASAAALPTATWARSVLVCAARDGRRWEYPAPDPRACGARTQVRALTMAEKELIETAARQSGLSVSEWARSVLSAECDNVLPI